MRETARCEIPGYRRGACPEPHGCRVVRGRGVMRILRVTGDRGGTGEAVAIRCHDVSSLQRDRIEPPQQVTTLELKLVDIAVLIGD